MTSLTRRPAVVCSILLAFASACAATNGDENCIADCDASPSEATDDGTGPAESGGDSAAAESGSESGTGDAAMACAELQAEAVAFYEANSDCTSVLDCQGVSSRCFPPGVPSACVGFAVSTSADLDAWAELDDQVFAACNGTSCLWEGECVAFAICNAEQRCVQEGDSVVACAAIRTEAEAFIEENTACTEDEDCLSVSSCTHGGPSCSPLALNTSANMADWARMELLFAEACDDEDDVASCSTFEGCEAAVRCGDGGHCEVAP